MKIRIYVYEKAGDSAPPIAGYFFIRIPNISGFFGSEYLDILNTESSLQQCNAVIFKFQKLDSHLNAM